MDILDPVTSDLPVTDWAFPPSKAPLTINSHGSNLFGLIYLAQGPGPHPLAILLHGAGGYEKNLDLAQVLRRAGWNTLTFHYRGFWGSEGEFTLENALADVHSVIKYVSRPKFQEESRSDAGRLTIIGHSLGASLAFMAGAEHPTVTQIGFLSGANLALYASYAQENGGEQQSNSEQSQLNRGRRGNRPRLFKCPHLFGKGHPGLAGSIKIDYRALFGKARCMKTMRSPRLFMGATDERGVIFRSHF